MRIGITAAYAGGRPQIAVNNWTSAAPAASSQPGSRSLTIGTYRGNNALYSYAVPASAFVTGTQHHDDHRDQRLRAAAATSVPASATTAWSCTEAGAGAA